LSLVQFVLSFFMAARTDTNMSRNEEPRPLRNKRRRQLSSTFLEEAVARLEAASQLLVTPTPQGIRDVGLLLEDAHMWVQRESPSTDNKSLAADLNDVQNALSRVRQLLHGALQVQSIQMRRVVAITQIYMPGGKIVRWRPQISNVDVNA
jgi:hypothetical protein